MRLDSKYSKELETMFEAAEEAGKIIDEFPEEGFETERKNDGSKVTEADRRSQEKIVEIISEKFPSDGFLGEEEHLTPEDEERVWVIDPIDGTFNFDSGFNHFCISIALKIEDEVVVGLVYSPESSLDKTYFAVKGGGSYMTDDSIEEAEQISVSEKSVLRDSIFFLSLYDIYEGELEAELQILEELAKKDCVHRQLGSCALEMCKIAAGGAEFQINPIIREWDYSAAKLIIEEAGGEVRIRDSKFPGCTEIISSNGLLQEKSERALGNHFTEN